MSTIKEVWILKTYIWRADWFIFGENVRLNLSCELGEAHLKLVEYHLFSLSFLINPTLGRWGKEMEVIVNINWIPWMLIK